MGIVLRDLGDDAVVTGAIALFPITSSTAVMGQGGGGRDSLGLPSYAKETSTSSSLDEIKAYAILTWD